MKLAGYGEDRLVRELTQKLAHGKNARVAIGDDCAAIGRKSDARWQLLKTDCVVEGIHFSKNDDPRKVGWKALARAFSDIAAMGGLPEYALVTLAAPPEMEVTYVKNFYAGLERLAKKFGVSVVGGETARSPGPFFCAITVTGVVEKSRCVTRGGGRAGDRLYVTGRLGGSIRGKHLTFTPRIGEARWLTRHFAIHAMMDLSDGLAADLPRLALAGKCDFEIFEKQLPLNRGCTPQNALSDGEDYELLFAIAPCDAKRMETSWRKKFQKLPLTHIGNFNQKSEIRNQKSDGFDHFA